MPTESKLQSAYRLLEIDHDAPLEAVKRAYRDMVKVWHPDRFPHDERLRARATAKTAELNEAFQLVCAYLKSAEDQQEAHPPRDASRTEPNVELGPIELLTTPAVPRKQNIFYWQILDAPQRGSLIRDAVADTPDASTISEFGQWPLSANFQKDAMTACSNAYVRVQSVPGLNEAQTNQQIGGAVIVRNRLILLNPKLASNLTPLFLLSIIEIRDALTNAQEEKKEKYLKRLLAALRYFGYRDDGLFQSESYSEAERLFASAIARAAFPLASKKIKPDGFIDTLMGYKSIFAVTVLRSTLGLAEWMGQMLILAGPIWTRSAAEKCFRAYRE